MLHSVTGDGGLGFCAAALPSLLPAQFHGPLVVALDSSVLIDLQQYGGHLLDDDEGLPESGYGEELVALGVVLNIWMLRDIRFIVTPTSLTDTRRSVTPAFLARRVPAVDAVARALAFQLGDWEYTAPSYLVDLDLVGHEHGLPVGNDPTLVLEAQSVGAHVFLTRDKRLRRRVSLTGPRLHVLAPSELADELVIAGATTMGGGTCGDASCPYGDCLLPAPDIGKWGPFMSLFDAAR